MSETDSKKRDAEAISFVSERSGSLVHQAMNAAGVGLFVLLLLLSFGQITNRFITAPLLGLSVTWTGEASRFLLVYMTFVGTVIASRDRDHVQINVFTKQLPEKLRSLALGIVHLLTLPFIAAAVWGGYLVTKDMIGVPPGATPLITMEYVYVAIPLGFLLMGLYELKCVGTFLNQFLSQRGERNE